MKVKDSDFFCDVIESHKFDIGKLYLFKHLAITEIKEGEHFCYESAYNLIMTIKDFYCNKSFGYLSNRINSYSIQALDYSKLTRAVGNLELFAVVSYKYNDAINMRIEQQFCEMPYKNFDSLKSAYNQINSYINAQSENSAVKYIKHHNL
ncbi:hypothetical protein [Lacinutrix chionoecetis]